MRFKMTADDAERRGQQWRWWKTVPQTSGCNRTVDRRVRRMYI